MTDRTTAVAELEPGPLFERTQAVVGSARGGRRVAAQGPVQVELVRVLTPEDVPLLVNPPPVGSSPPTIASIRHSHHQLARLLAEGREQAEVALITGYSPSRISILKGDPAFAELLAYYAIQREQVFVDVMERMRALGLDSLEEIQARMNETPEKFSARELFELTELMLVKGRAAPGSSQGAGAGQVGLGNGGVNVQVTFVSAPAKIIEGQVASEVGLFEPEEKL